MAQTNKKKKNNQQVSPLEVVKEVPKGVAQGLRDVVADTARATLEQLLGNQRQDNSATKAKKKEFVNGDGNVFDFESYLFQQEKTIRAQEKAYFQYQQKEEQLVYSAQQEEIKKQISLLQKELAGLAKSVKGVSREVDKAIMQMPSEAGVYHVNFLKRIREWISIMKKRIDSSQTWLAIYNRRTIRKGYWMFAKTYGTKYSLSAERALATQAG